jgi:hypothetical protein
MMPDYMHDGDVKALLTLAQSLPRLPVLDALAAVAQLGRGVEALALEVLSLRQRAQGDAMNLTRYATALRDKDDELNLAHAKAEALAKRLATRAA